MREFETSENVEEPDMKGIEEGFDAKADFLQHERGRVRTSSHVFRNKEHPGAKQQMSASFNMRGEEIKSGNLAMPPDYDFRSIVSVG